MAALRKALHFRERLKVVGSGRCEIGHHGQKALNFLDASVRYLAVFGCLDHSRMFPPLSFLLGRYSTNGV